MHTFTFKLLPMKEITLPVHPFSRQILLHEHGRQEPIIVMNRDALFALLSTTRIKRRPVTPATAQVLTAHVSICLDDQIARHVIENAADIGLLLFKIHKEIMCRYVQAYCVNGRQALTALRQFYHLHGVSEDDYQMESAWKTWMRWSKTREKKRLFFAQKMDKASALLSKKRSPRARLTPRLQKHTWAADQIHIELSTARFLSAYSELYKRVPMRLKKQVRLYYTHRAYSVSTHALAAHYGIPQRSACYALHAIRRKAERNPTLRRLLDESFALPKPPCR